MKGASHWFIALAVIWAALVILFTLRITNNHKQQNPSSAYQTKYDEELNHFEIKINLNHAKLLRLKGYPENTTVCGIKIGDTFADVIEKFGKNYRVSTTCYNDHAVIIYGDPKAKAEIAFFGKDKEVKPDNVIFDIQVYEYTLKDLEYLASFEFAQLPDINGIKVGDPLSKLETIIGKLPQIPKDTYETRVLIQCYQKPETWFYYILEDGKIKYIASCQRNIQDG